MQCGLDTDLTKITYDSVDLITADRWFVVLRSTLKSYYIRIQFGFKEVKLVLMVTKRVPVQGAKEIKLLMMVTKYVSVYGAKEMKLVLMMTNHLCHSTK